MIRVAIVEDHPAIAEGLRALLNGERIQVVGTASTVGTAETLIHEQHPDVVLCDIMLHGRDEGLDLVARLRGESRFIILSAYDYPAHHARAIASGASGYLTKMAEANEIVAAVEAVAAGQSGFAPAVVESARRAPRPPTPREREMLVALAHGGSNDDIAASMLISVKTVEGMMRRLFERYSVGNRTELVRLANQQGWLTSEPL